MIGSISVPSYSTAPVNRKSAHIIFFLLLLRHFSTRVDPAATFNGQAIRIMRELKMARVFRTSMHDTVNNLLIAKGEHGICITVEIIVKQTIKGRPE
jgi:hypothetical protein